MNQGAKYEARIGAELDIRWQRNKYNNKKKNNKAMQNVKHRKQPPAELTHTSSTASGREHAGVQALRRRSRTETTGPVRPKQDPGNSSGPAKMSRTPLPSRTQREAQQQRQEKGRTIERGVGLTGSVQSDQTKNCEAARPAWKESDYIVLLFRSSSGAAERASDL